MFWKLHLENACPPPQGSLCSLIHIISIFTMFSYLPPTKRRECIPSQNCTRCWHGKGEKETIEKIILFFLREKNQDQLLNKKQNKSRRTFVAFFYQKKMAIRLEVGTSLISLKSQNS
uniref:Uncharacterized protein n=1 Tax=Nelumbo nucifera TaxID=4432 RepID=A0A822XQP9_NELNU|nr:TPA_asm: hypothetical protein HUJ06_022944 [Nelumbo nucifera]